MDAVTLPLEQTQIAGRGSARMVGKPYPTGLWKGCHPGTGSLHLEHDVTRPNGTSAALRVSQCLSNSLAVICLR